MNAERLYRILSLDGGGIRGILSGEVLTALEKKIIEKTGNPKARLAEYFDLIAGTSTGGILTCLILCPDDHNPGYPKYSAQEAVDLYLLNGKKIFKPTISGRLPGLLSGLLGAKFESSDLEVLLKEKFGDIKLSDLVKPSLIASYDIEQRKAVFFTQHDAKANPADDFYVRDIARATSAAPTFFSPTIIPAINKDQYYSIDGGVYANNPAMCAAVEALKLFSPSENELLSPSNMFLLSISTGSIKKPYSYEKARRWGLVGWVSPLINIMMSGVSETVDYQLRKLFMSINRSQNYARIEPALGNASQEMDDVSDQNLKALSQSGISCAQKNDDLLNTIVDVLIKNQPAIA